MPINRAPFNALVDDDGSNSVGTPWNKAAIAGVILDPVDAALGLIGQPWAAVPFDPAAFTSNGGTWSVATVAGNSYTLIGQTLLWSFSINAAVATDAGTYLLCRIPAGLTLLSAMPLPCPLATDASGGHVAAIAVAYSPTQIGIQRANSAPWGTIAAQYLVVTAIVQIQ